MSFPQRGCPSQCSATPAGLDLGVESSGRRSWGCGVTVNARSGAQQPQDRAAGSTLRSPASVRQRRTDGHQLPWMRPEDLCSHCWDAVGSCFLRQNVREVRAARFSADSHAEHGVDQAATILASNQSSLPAFNWVKGSDSRPPDRGRPGQPTATARPVPRRSTEIKWSSTRPRYEARSRARTDPLVWTRAATTANARASRDVGPTGRPRMRKTVAEERG